MIASLNGARSREVPARRPDLGLAPSFPLIEWLLIFLSFAIFATVRSPVPGVNEPHYLTKSKHFWDETWCQRDPFLQSANAHLVFYATIGALTKVCSLETSAWLGRVVGWLLLSSGWTALAARLLPFRGGAVCSAWVFLLLAALGNWSGEWVVGGIEAKVLAYGCCWWSLACALSGQTVRAAAWSGAAVSFHPVVGIWNTAAVVFAIAVDDWRIWHSLRRLDWRRWALSAVMWLILAAPGLLPAVAMLGAANRQQAYQADFIQVFYRLAHHLDPWQFSARGYIGYLVLLLLSGGLYGFALRNLRATGRAGASSSNNPAISTGTASDTVLENLTRSQQSIASTSLSKWNLTARYVFAAVLIALSGVIVRAIPTVAGWILDRNWLPAAKSMLQSCVDYQPKLASLLKYYPFRLADVVIPWAASALLIQAIRSRVVPQLCWVLGGICFVISLALPATDRNPSRLSPEHLTDWTDACQWVQRETPIDALCYSANDGWALKWYAHRAEYLSFKDCPQDAPGIVAWNNRFKLVSAWSSRSAADGYSRDELRELRRLTQIDYLIVRRFGPILMEPIYRNRSYQVYRLPD